MILIWKRLLINLWRLSLLWTTYPAYVVTVILPSFSWDPRNECFENPKGAFLQVDEESQLYFLCPSMAVTVKVQEYVTSEKNMYENMFMVTEDEFEKCIVGPESSRPVLKCDNPLDHQMLQHKLISFKQFQTGPMDFAFGVGKTYYFIATSNGTRKSLDNKEGGRCLEGKMKLRIKICSQGTNCHQRNKPCSLGGKNFLSTRMPNQTSHRPCLRPDDLKRFVAMKSKSAKYDGQCCGGPPLKYLIIIGISAFLGGIVLCFIVVTIYRRSCRSFRRQFRRSSSKMSPGESLKAGIPT